MGARVRIMAECKSEREREGKHDSEKKMECQSVKCNSVLWSQRV